MLLQVDRGLVRIPNEQASPHLMVNGFTHIPTPSQISLVSASHTPSCLAAGKVAYDLIIVKRKKNRSRSLPSSIRMSQLPILWDMHAVFLLTRTSFSRS
jgi:hypothetical protein